MKKLFGILFLAALLAALHAGAWAEAPAFSERGGNETRESAETICLNAPMNGALTDTDGARDRDFYRLYVPAPGSVAIHFTHDYIDSSGTCAKLILYPADNDSALWGREAAGNRTEMDYDEFYLDQGTYDLVVMSDTSAQIQYQLLAEYASSETCETEENGAPTAADAISANEWIQGSFALNDDQDYYVFTLDAPGEVNLAFTHEYFDATGSYYQITLTQGMSGRTHEAVSLSGRDSDYMSNPFYLDADTYYLKIEDCYHTSVPYAFRIGYAPKENTEIETNDSFASATPVAVNAEILGSFPVQGDSDYYKFTLESPGMLEFHHEHAYFDESGTYFSVGLFDGMSTDALLYSVSIAGRDSDVTHTPIYLPAGTYYVRYEDYYWTSSPYLFMLSYTAMDNIELERNDVYQTATPVEVNKSYMGSLMNDKDTDTYSFTLDALSEVTLNFNFTYFDDGGTYFTIYLDLAPRSDQTYSYNALTGRDNEMKTNPFYLPPGTYYLRVTNYRWTNAPYSIMVEASPCENCEIEWNNSYDTATAITAGVSVQGAIRYQDDMDYYVLTVTERRTVSIYFQHDWFDDNASYYRVYLDAEPNNSQRLASFEVKGSESSIQTTDSFTLNPGTYYLSVEDGGHWTTVPYILTVK